MESISIFEMIKVGIGPSSSHTMGPWIASELLLATLEKEEKLSEVLSVDVKLYGSLAKTGKGHGTDVAVMMGLSGEKYSEIDTQTIPKKVENIKIVGSIDLAGNHKINFDPKVNFIYNLSDVIPFHPNCIEFTATLKDGEIITRKYFSIGGGFVATETENTIQINSISTPYPCHHAEDIIKNCSKLGVSISELVLINEQAWLTKREIESKALYIWHEIKDCIFRGLKNDGILPGGLQVKRRAREISQHLLDNQSFKDTDSLIKHLKNEEKEFSKINKWISCFALAVNEENASFGRIITAPTNGASGVIPAVLMYAYCFVKGFDEEKVVRFILTAGEIGTIFKKNATISAAVGGCQAEIGVSSSMAAAGLTECLGGSPGQVLMAAEIAMEHHLGLTCDPVGGLVQIPCIERNAMGAIKAITASNIALESDPKSAKVSLDAVIESMWNTAKEMNSKFKETSEGGLAATIPVNVAEC